MCINNSQQDEKKVQIDYKSHSGKKAALKAFLLKQVAKQVSSVLGISVSIPIAPSPSASHLAIILSTEPMILRTPRAKNGRAAMAISSSSLSSLSFWLVSRYLAAHLTMCGRLGQEGSSKHVPSVAHSFSVSEALVETKISAIRRRMEWMESFIMDGQSGGLCCFFF